MLITCRPVQPTALQAGLVGYVEEEEGGKLWRDAASERTHARRKGREVVSARSGRMTDEPSTIICHSEFSRSGPGRERLLPDIQVKNPINAPLSENVPFRSERSANVE